jgi:WD40 repeat protein
LPAFFDALESAEIYDPRTGDFTATGSMAKGRWFHTATLLPDGKVLIIGGLDYVSSNLSFVSTADLWDPATGEFTVVATLADARAFHTATLLKDGRVLVAGGANINGVLSSAEIFDPATNQLTVVGSLKTKRDFAAATLLPDGRVLVAGGEDGAVNLSSAELFDPATGAFSDAGSTTVPRRRHSMTLLRSGLVLVSGGRGPSGMLSSQELFDPQADSGKGIFTTTGSMLGPRGWHTATLMPTGHVLLIGGEDGTNRILAAESYDPSSATNSPAGSMTVERDEPSAVLLASGQVLVVGGGVNALAEVFDPLGGGTAGAVAATAPMGAARASFTATRLASGKILIAGGSNTSGTPLSTAEVFDPSTGAFVTTGAMSSARVRHAATLLPSGKVLVTGGQGSAGTNASGEIYDPDAAGGTGAFQLVAGNMSSARSSHTSTLLPTGHVLVAGGISGGTSGLATADLFDPVAGTFVALPSKLTVARAGHTATLLPTGDVLLVGSLQGTSAERYHPGPDGVGNFVITGLPSQPRVTHTATLLPSGKVLIAGGLDPSLPISSCEIYDPGGGNGAGTFSPAGSLSIGRGGHMAVLLPSGKVLVAGGCTSLDCTTRTATAELFDPTAAAGAGVFTPTTSLGGPRDGGAAALLPSGDVLLAGGATMTAFATTTADRWSDGAAIAAAWRPVVSSAPTPTAAGVPVAITGSGLVGTSEGSSGRTGASANNRPIAVWMPAAGGMSMGPIAPSAPTNGTWTPPASALVGPGWLHVVVSGIIGPGRFVTLAQAPVGVPCAVAAQCASNACIDGFCCQEACDGPCQACSAAKTSGTLDGICGPIAADTDPENDCGVQNPSTCGTTGVCDGTGACALHPSSTLCAPASCSGVILSNPHECDGAGTCTATPVVNCSPFLCIDPVDAPAACTTSCATTGDCAPGAFCDANQCKNPQANGAPCTSPSQCQSLQCIDGFCCNSDCAGICLACSSANKASGPDGICGPAAAGQDPHDDCDEEEPTSCGQDGQCNGAGSCRLHSATTPCGDTSCQNGNNGSHSKQGGPFCDGFGDCTVVEGLDCGLYLCEDLDVCGTQCTDATDCIPTAYCHPVTGTCEQKLAQADPCELDVQCPLEHCVDGLCCNAPCDQDCVACNEPGHFGVCTAVSGEPRGTRDACGVGECAGTCDGTSFECIFPTSGCGETTCTDGVAHPHYCDGAGQCGGPTNVECVQYACGDDGCKTSCATNADCSALFRCDGGKCVPRTDTECDGDHTLIGADGQRLDCSPYRCNAANVCLADCASSAECVLGSQCSADSKCTTPALPRVPDASCGCRVVGATADSRWSAAALALLAAAAALSRARSRRRRIEDRC